MNVPEPLFFWGGACSKPGRLGWLPWVLTCVTIGVELMLKARREMPLGGTVGGCQQGTL